MAKKFSLAFIFFSCSLFLHTANSFPLGCGDCGGDDFGDFGESFGCSEFSTGFDDCASDCCSRQLINVPVLRRVCGPRCLPSCGLRCCCDSCGCSDGGFRDSDAICERRPILPLKCRGGFNILQFIPNILSSLVTSILPPPITRIPLPPAICPC